MGKKIDEVEEYQVYVPSEKQKNDKDDASITSNKKITQLTWQKNQGKMWLSNPAHLLPPQKRTLAKEKKQKNHTHTQIQLVPAKY